MFLPTVIGNARLTERLPLTIEERASFGLSSQGGRSKEAFMWDLLELAEHGRRLFAAVFHDVVPPEGMSPTQWVNALRAAISKSSRVIQVARTGYADYVFPWALVYDHPLPGVESDYKFCPIIDEWGNDGRRVVADIGLCCPYSDEKYHQENIICPHGFWGLRHRIEQPPSLPKANTEASGRRAIRVDSGQLLQLKAAFTADETLDGDLIEKHSLKLSGFSRVQYGTPPATDWTGVRSALVSPQVMYFLCHGEYDQELDDPYLGVGPRDKDPQHRVYASKIVDYLTSAKVNPDEWVRNSPLIIINGCHTADLAPGRLLSFVTNFSQAGASGVIGTEVSVVLPVAVEVGETLLRSLIGTPVEPGMAVADAIRTIRWELANRGNLLGLAYTSYCFADLKINYQTPPPATPGNLRPP